MPTSRRRHAITETDDIKSALAAAARRWPRLAGKPGRLLHRLIIEGGEAVQQEREQAGCKRAAAIEATKGVLAGVYGPDYLTALREDWPV
ncbi:hypothetical protein [Mycobacterium sp.]|uniref:hypothetical protein n=1 Tax=Mycobacterium sp. TaxID=1785 RepID=UPI003D6ABCC9